MTPASPPLTTEELTMLVRRLDPARADAPREEWVKVGMAIKSANAGQVGYDLFDQFSRQSTAKYRPRDTLATWRSISASGGITAGSLVHWANEDDPAGKRASSTTTKRAYQSLADYAEAHHTTAEAFRQAGWRAVMRHGRSALEFLTSTGPRWRFLDGQKPSYDSPGGYKRSWYRLSEAIDLARMSDSPLIFVNGEASVVAAQSHGYAAFCIAGGSEKPSIPTELLTELLTLWQGAIIVALDCDRDGRAAALPLAAQLTKAGLPSRAVDLRGSWGFDFADFCGLHNGSTLAELRTLPDLEDPAAAREDRNEALDVDFDDEPAEVIDLPPASTFPELPSSAQLPEELEQDACPWLDRYISFSSYWSPRSYEGFHEACGLWVLSTIAARRVMLPFGGSKYTNLYIALCARTSLWAKSTAARIASETIHAVGLGSLLAADNATPQAFIKDLAEHLPENWDGLSTGLQDTHRQRLAFAGQRGWSYEEFGQHLSAMMRDNSTMADYRGHLRRFDDCPPSYQYLTIGRGANTIQRPYLALLANLTPADLAPHARKGSALWNDGFFARYAFITPPASADRRRDRFPMGERSIPESLTKPLRDWHAQLGTPDVAVVEQKDERGRPSGVYQLTVTPATGMRCVLGDGVYDAFYHYLEALTDLIATNQTPADLDGSYTRFPEKALRIAMLLASLTNNGTIELSHWARAQAITERWRRSLHHLIDQLSTPEDSPARVLEDKVLKLLGRKVKATARDVGRDLHISTDEAERILEQLGRTGVLTMEQGKRTKRYQLAQTVASVASVAPSQVSQIPAGRDTSIGGQGGALEVSQNRDSSDTMTYVTVATLPVRATPEPSLHLSGGTTRYADLAARYEAVRGFPPDTNLWSVEELDELVSTLERQSAVEDS